LAVSVRPTRGLPEIRGMATFLGTRLVLADDEPATSSCARNASAIRVKAALWR
jgi:hypothetical protein